MRSWCSRAVIAAAAMAACQFTRNETQIDGARPDVAPPLPDAGPCVTTSAECASADVLRVCATAGGSAVDTTCSWGCRSDDGAAHCALLSPSGGSVTPTDTVGSDVGSATLNNATIDQSTGAIANGATNRAAGTGVIGGIDFELRNGVGVFRFGDLVIQGNLSFTGTGPVALVSTGSITVTAAIDGIGNCVGATGGPGGSPGGIGHTSAAGSGGGEAGTDDTLGASGGGYGAVGGSGGDAGGELAVPGGPAFGDPTIAILAGGGGGGGGNGGNPFGGGGGGAIQLVANQTLTITAPASINAGGCGGTSGTAVTDTGGGGGAGGSILLEAHDITVNGWLAVNGGGGGGNYYDNPPCTTSTARGANGALSRTPATGVGGCAANGGAGGAANLAAGAGLDGPYMGVGDYAAGGGGAVGRIRFNTRSGSAAVDNTQLSPALDDNPTTCTAGSANTQ